MTKDDGGEREGVDVDGPSGSTGGTLGQGPRSQNNTPKSLFSFNASSTFAFGVPSTLGVPSATTIAPAFQFGTPPGTVTTTTTPTATGSPSTRTVSPRRHHHHSSSHHRSNRHHKKKQSPSASSPSFLFLPSSPPTVASTPESTDTAATTKPVAAAPVIVVGALSASAAPSDAIEGSESPAPASGLSLAERRSHLYQDLHRVVWFHKKQKNKLANPKVESDATVSFTPSSSSSSSSSLSFNVVRHFLFEHYEEEEDQQKAGKEQEKADETTETDGAETSKREEEEAKPDAAKEAKSDGKSANPSRTQRKKKNPRDFAAGRDTYGRTPLHIAAYYGADVEAVRLLLEVYPEAAYQKDNRGHIPIQVAFHGAGLGGRSSSSTSHNMVRLDLIETLLKAHPAAVFQDATEFSPSGNNAAQFSSEQGPATATFSVGITSKPLEVSPTVLEVPGAKKPGVEEGEGAGDTKANGESATTAEGDRGTKPDGDEQTKPEGDKEAEPDGGKDARPDGECDANDEKVGKTKSDEMESKGADAEGATKAGGDDETKADGEVVKTKADGDVADDTKADEENGETNSDADTKAGAEEETKVDGERDDEKKAKGDVEVNSETETKGKGNGETTADGEGGENKADTVEGDNNPEGEGETDNERGDGDDNSATGEATQDDTQEDGEKKDDDATKKEESGGDDQHDPFAVDVPTPGKKLSLLHLAASNDVFCEPGVLETILRANPGAALERDNKGRTPLHILLTPASPLSPYTVIEPPSMEVIRAILGRSDDDKLGALSTFDPREVAAIQDSNGRTPLHMAVNHGVEMEVLQMLLDVFPEAASMKDSASHTPLHVAFWGLAASFRMNAGNGKDAVQKKVLEAILRARPEAALEVSKDHQTPLHLALFKRDFCEDGIFELILKAYPPAVLQRDDRGRMFLHTLITELARKANSGVKDIMKFVRLLLAPDDSDDANRIDKKHVYAKELAAAEDFNGCQPLHLAAEQCVREEFEEVIRLLMDVYPEAASHKDKQGRVPIHLLLLGAFRRSSLRGSRSWDPDSTSYPLIPQKALRALLDAFPDAASEHVDSTTKFGATVKNQSLLHLAAMNSAHCRVEDFEMIQKANPSAALRADSLGMTPLHCLISNSLADALWGGSEDVLEKMKILLRVAETTVRIAPKDDNSANACSTVKTTAAAAKDREGMTPLHSVLSLHVRCSTEMIVTLLEACPAAAGSRDKQGRLPLNIALSRTPRPFGYLKELVDAYPAAMTEKDGSNNTNLHLLLGSPCSVEDLELFLDANIEDATKYDGAGLTPLQKALSQWTGASMEAGIVRLMSEKCPGAITTKSHNGQSTLHMAVANQTAANIIEMLVEVDPEAAAELWELDKTTALSHAVVQGDEEVCRILLKHCPQSARTLLDDDTTALHRASTEGVIRDLVQAWPEALSQKSAKKRQTPMHFWVLDGLLSGGYDSQALEDLKQNPSIDLLEIVKTTDNRGLTPLHYAFGNCTHDGQLTHDAVETALDRPVGVMLLRAYPDALFLHVAGAGEKKRKNNDEDNEDEEDDDDNGDDDDIPIDGLLGSSIVGRLCDSDTVAETLQLLFEKLSGPSDGSSSEDAQENEESKDTSSDDGDELAVWFLRKACEHASGLDIVSVIRLCHNRHASCVRTASESGDLPLHIACRQENCCVEVVQELTELYGAALTMEDSKGQVPFILACLNNAPVDVTFHLLRSAPDIIFG